MLKYWPRRIPGRKPFAVAAKQKNIIELSDFDKGKFMRRVYARFVPALQYNVTSHISLTSVRYPDPQPHGVHPPL
jgi:hypothetical protein